MRSLVGGIAVAAAAVALSLGGLISATQTVEFHGLQFVVPGDGEIRFGTDTRVVSFSDSPQPQIQTAQDVHLRVDVISKRG
ncbi:MAG: hypothetical protein JWM49_1130 [Microbacteriaceae bacterium]|nr:hypothetical protein [Microbacteriaceae bacterium]